MIRGAYYNEIDPYAAQWLRNLIAAGHIATGDVDERSIELVRPDDLRGYAQCHFFAGIGVWSHALRLAGWPDDRPVWTGSCPCQPFSTAGKRLGHEDERHLWPTWFRLIRELAPVRVFGEQVANGDGAAWLDHVATDLEGAGYAVGALSAPACGFGAPHWRQRLYFVADAAGGHAGKREIQPRGLDGLRAQVRRDPRAAGDGERPEAGRLADHDEAGRRIERRSRLSSDCDASHRHNTDGRGESGLMGNAEGRAAGSGNDLRGRESDARAAGELGHPDDARPQGRRLSEVLAGGGGSDEFAPRASGPVNGFWRNAEWIDCRDGKARPVEPGTFPLAHGAPARVGRLRAYGNAIVAPQAAEFVRAYLSVKESA